MRERFFRFFIEKSKNRHISSEICATSTKFGTMTQFDNCSDR